MTAEPIGHGDPNDPRVILDRLPDRARRHFLAEYEAAVEAAREVDGYRKLRQLLQSWSVRAVAYAKPDFHERYEEIRAGRGEYITLEEVVARRHGS
jgi:hypothetical protein